ncbi:hypothetical protein FRC07_006720 [Ceratobasidium sp. 392]|nr:hypothetical protein FRC07_006720 [Ceratobasidium sp. 392]
MHILAQLVLFAISVLGLMGAVAAAPIQPRTTGANDSQLVAALGKSLYDKYMIGQYLHDAQHV